MTSSYSEQSIPVSRAAWSAPVLEVADLYEAARRGLSAARPAQHAARGAFAAIDPMIASKDVGADSWSSSGFDPDKKRGSGEDNPAKNRT